MLDGDSEAVVDALSDTLDESILMQNMDSLFKLSLKTSDSELKNVFKTNVVYYLSLLSTLSSFVNKPSAILDKYIDAWKIDCIKQGISINNYFASVEIVSPSGIIQRVFFSIPDFVLTYWSYPRVQEAKEKTLWEVSRESPEDKMADFFLKMQALTVVMRRQQWLTTLFPPFKWMRSLLKPGSAVTYLPLIGIRELILYLTLFLNVYYAYLNYRETYPWYREREADWFR